MKTDTELKQLLATMLPDKLQYHQPANGFSDVFLYRNPFGEVKDTELLSLCREVEEAVTGIETIQEGR